MDEQKKKRKIFLTLLPIVIILLVLLIDQISKKMIYDFFTFEPKSDKIINIFGDVLTLKYVENRGLVFGLFSDSAFEWKYFIFITLTIIAILILIFFYKKIRKDKIIIRLSFGLILGGALGNFIDRVFGYIIFKGEWKLFYARVVDFISFELKSIGFSWPLFNVADISIFLGEVLLIIFLITTKAKHLFIEKEDKSTDNQSDNNENVSAQEIKS